MVMNYERIFGTKPKQYTSPLEVSYHPEIDLSEEMDEKGIKKYLSLID